MPPRDVPIDPTGLPAEYDERLIRIAQLHYDFVIEPGEDAALLCWDAEKREWLTWAQWIFNRQPR